MIAHRPLRWLLTGAATATAILGVLGTPEAGVERSSVSPNTTVEIAQRQRFDGHVQDDDGTPFRPHGTSTNGPIVPIQPGDAGNGVAPQGPLIQPPAAPQPDAKLYTPFDSVVFAANDMTLLASGGEIDPIYIRWLSLYNIPSDQRIRVLQLLSFAINSVSRARDIQPLYVVPGSDNTLVRINLYDLEISPYAFDQLCQLGSGRAPLPEPYFQQFYTITESYTETVYVTDDAGKYVYDHSSRQWKTRQVQKTRQKQFLAPAVWLHRDGSETITQIIGTERKTLKDKPVPISKIFPFKGKRINYLTTITHSQNPIARADWFIVYGLWAPQYYNLLGLKGSEEDFENLLLVDNKRGRKVKLAGVIAGNRDPQVALNNRFLTRVPTINGEYGAYYWETHDTNRSTNERAYLNNIIDFLKVEQGIIPRKKVKPFFDATENIGQLRNGLQAYWLGDANGKQLNKADPDVAQDSYTTLQDKQVWSARNCIMCHVEGIRPFNEAVRTLAQQEPLNADTIKFLVVDDDAKKTNSRLIDDLFRISLDPAAQLDQVRYDVAVRKATAISIPGVLPLTMGQNAAAYMLLNHEYLDLPVSMAGLAFEMGYPADKLNAVLKLGQGIDFTLTGLLKKTFEPIRRDQLENNAFPQGMLYLEGFREPWKEPAVSIFKVPVPEKKKAP